MASRLRRTRRTGEREHSIGRKAWRGEKTKRELKAEAAERKRKAAAGEAPAPEPVTPTE